MKKKKVKVGKIIGIIVFTLIVFGVSYVTTYYVDKWQKGSGTAKISVLFDDNEYYVMPNSSVLEKEKALLEWPYIFTIKNSGEKAGIYQIIITDDSENDIKRDALSYILLLDDKEVKAGKLSDIKNNVVYENSIVSEKEQHYKLYIYKSIEETGETYKYSLKVNAIEEGGPGF